MIGDARGIIRLLRERYRPKDVLVQQQKVARAEALAFIAPVHFLSFPAMLKGWLDRVWTPGFAYDLSPEAWRGDINGRQPKLTHAKALIIQTTIFDKPSHDAGLRDGMRMVIDEFTLTYPGIKNVEHEFFYAVYGADDPTRRGYLEKAYAPWVASSEPASKAARAAANPESTNASSRSSPTIPLNLAGDLTTVPTSTLRRRSMSNLLRMGHCAPTVMQTLLDASDTEAEWLVKLTAGLPGGIGNTGAECGGVTAPLVLIGLRHARDAVHDGLPPVIDRGTTSCSALRAVTAPPSAVRFAAPTGCRCDASEPFVRHPNSARRRC